MATITIDIPNGVAARLTDAFAATYSYQATIPNGSGGTMPNPETRSQFAQRMLREYAKNVLISYEAQSAAEVARATAETKAKGDFGA